MKTKRFIFALTAIICLARVADGQQTAFTYQGRLNSAGAPANGRFDLVFALYDSNLGGSLIAGPLTSRTVAVSNGLFATTIDFGAAAFTGGERWLEIAVRPTGQPVFTTLIPRQSISAAPYAIQAGTVADHAVTAAKLADYSVIPSKLGAGPGANGQVLKMNGGVMTWGADLNSGGTVTSIGTGKGLTGGPITGAGALSIDTNVVPQLTRSNLFTGPQVVVSGGGANRALIVRGVGGQGNNLQEWQDSSGKALASISAAGVINGDGAGLSNVTATLATSVADRTITANKLSTGPGANGQVLKMNGGQIGWGTDLNTGGTVTSVSAGTGLTGGPITSSGTLSVDQSVVPLLGSANVFSGPNTFTGVALFANPASFFQGRFTGDGSGLTNLAVTSTNVSVALGGDVTGPESSTTVARIRGVNVSVLPPSPAQFLRFDGASWTPGAVALASDVSGALPLVNGGTAASSASAARANLGAAASGANSDITSLAGLTTPLSIAQGGSGANSVSGARANLGAAASGANFDITALGGLTTPLSISQGGSGASTAPGARLNLGAAASGANTDITSLSSLTTPLSISQGGSGANSASGARANLGAAASGANSDITSLNSLSTPFSTAQGGTGAGTPAGARANLGAAGSGANSDITSLTGLKNLVVRGTNGQTGNLQEWQDSSSAVLAGVSVSGVFAGNGSGLSALNASSISSGTLSDARLSANVPFLSGNQTFSGPNNFSSPANVFVGSFTGNGAGLTNVPVNATNITITMGGDVSGPSGNAIVARIRGVNVSPGAPNANQVLRYDGANWAPAGVALATDVSGTLSVANGGTSASSASGARANLGAAASGANSDITSLAGLSTPLSIAQGGSGANLSSGARANFGAAASGANSDITSLVGLTTPLSIGQGGSGSTTPAGARASFGAAASGVNSDLTSLLGLNAVVVQATNGQSGNLQVWRDSSSAVVASVSTFGVISGNGGGLAGLNASGISVGTLSDGRLSANVALLAANQTFTGSNTFNGGGSFLNPANRFVGKFSGDGSGLTNLVVSSTNVSLTLAGDVTGPQNNTTVARIRGVNVNAAAPAPNQVLRYDGANWTPAGVALGTDVSGTLGIANGGTAASSASGARLNLGAAANGANADITSLSGLITPLSNSQGGTGQSNYTTGDILYASSANTLARRSVGSAGQVLTTSNGAPAWAAANSHDHFGQSWVGAADGSDGLVVQNTSLVDGSSALTGLASGTSGLNYGVLGQTVSPDGSGVEGDNFAGAGFSIGVFGQSTSPDGAGVYGLGASTTGTPVGVYGEASSTNGIGVYGYCTSTSGVPVAVYGYVYSPTGYGFYTPDRLYVGSDAFLIGQVTVGSISGPGGGLTGLNAANISSGTVADARLSTNVALRAGNQTFSGTNTFTAGAKVLIDSGTSNAPALAFRTSLAAGLFSPATNVVGIATAGLERMRVAADGKVGIGRVAAANLLELGGEASKATAGSWLANSDARIKTDVQSIKNALEKIDAVHPVSFRYTEEYRQANPGIVDKTYYNVVAQEFANVFPEAVKSSGEMLDGKPILQVDTYPATICSIAALQELHALVKTKDAELKMLKDQNAALEKRLTALEARILSANNK